MTEAYILGKIQANGYSKTWQGAAFEISVTCSTGDQDAMQVSAS